MKILWICLFFVSVAVATSIDGDEDGWYDNFWYDEDEKSGFSDEEIELPVPIESDETNNDVFQDKSVEQSSEQTNKTENANVTQSTFEEYQFEDTRSEVNKDNTSNVNSTILDRDDTIASFTNYFSENIIPVDAMSTTNSDQNSTSSENIFKSLTKAYSEKDILDETNVILNESIKNDFDNLDVGTENDTFPDIEKFIQENNSVLVSDRSESFEDNVENKSVNENNDENNDSEESTVDLAFNDFMADLDKLKETWSKLKDSEDHNADDFVVGEDSKNDKSLSVDDDDYEEISDDNLQKLFEEIFNESNENDNENDFDLELHDEAPPEAESTPKFYTNDALFASGTENKNNSNETDILVIPVVIEQPQKESESITSVIDAPNMKDLSRSEEEKLPEDFTAKKVSLMQITADDITNATQLRLTVDDPVEITSPGYPQRYPTNQVVDWMISGDGMGIELNITDFAINSHVGDYVLIKPGGEDISGSTGLLFSYSLNSPKYYRFLDVDKMFIRFKAMGRMQILRGFKMSARMVAPRPGALEPVPEPEPVLPEPPATITLYLGGVSLENFIFIEEQFREIIADMAFVYITRNGIEPGLNTTSETTQITSKAICFHNWPAFEHCTEVQFGVPLVYDNIDEEEARLHEDDLRDMWRIYSIQDPFATRLSMLGITEYQAPDNRSVLTMWLVVAGGVVLCMAILAFALWSCNCFADYKRMPSFSDTDSINEKKNLDLYPTPHQTLPPLYSENHYKWADANYDDNVKVEIGGYSNKSYMHNDLFTLDSDEEVVSTRDRNSGISPRDIYSV